MAASIGMDPDSYYNVITNSPLLCFCCWGRGGLSNEMAPKRFRLTLYKPTTWQCCVFPVMFIVLLCCYWLHTSVCQLTSEPTPKISLLDMEHPVLFHVHLMNDDNMHCNIGCATFTIS